MLSDCNMFVTPNSHFCVVKIKQAINMRKILLSVMLAQERREKRKCNHYYLF